MIKSGHSATMADIPKTFLIFNTEPPVNAEILWTRKQRFRVKPVNVHFSFKLHWSYTLDRARRGIKNKVLNMLIIKAEEWLD